MGLLDLYVLDKGPKFLGEPIVIGGPTPCQTLSTIGASQPCLPVPPVAPAASATTASKEADTASAAAATSAQRSTSSAMATHGAAPASTP
jgi:SanA protein